MGRPFSEQSGQHLLALSLSGLYPFETFAVRIVDKLDAEQA
jgi:hypothetical protein